MGFSDLQGVMKSLLHDAKDADMTIPYQGKISEATVPLFALGHPFLMVL
jgi:hypothetical protein